MGTELGEHITEPRRKLKLSQNELGKKVGTSSDIIGCFESSEVKPFIRIATKIMDTFGVSLDFLIGKMDVEVDGDILKCVPKVQQIEEADRAHILYTLDALTKNVILRTIA